MAIRRKNPYAKAYSFGTEGNAALAGSPISRRRPMDTPPGRSPKRRRGIYVPRWIILTVGAILFLVMVNAYGRVNEEKAMLQQEIADQYSEIERSQEQMDSLDEQLLLAAEENKILASAVNRLSMQMPTRDQLVTIPAPHVVTEQEAFAGKSNESVSLFRLLLNSITGQ